MSNPLERKYLGADELTGWRLRAYIVIFESDTPRGKAFDVALIGAIVTSVVAVMLESVSDIRAQYGSLLYAAEWIFTILFTVEYFLRLACVGRPSRYAKSFFGVVDLLAVVPTYFSVLIPEVQFLLVIRLLRILRVFRVLKLVHFISEADMLVSALRASRRKILIFMFAVVNLVVVLGSMMYLIEGPANGFHNIPTGVYWAIVTLTTVGFGDITPQTPLGQGLAAFVMIIGYAIIAVPTGIVTSEITRHSIRDREARVVACPGCGRVTHGPDAAFCSACGAEIPGPQPDAEVTLTAPPNEQRS